MHKLSTGTTKIVGPIGTLMLENQIRADGVEYWVANLRQGDGVLDWVSSGGQFIDSWESRN